MLETFSALQTAEYSGITLQQHRRAFDHEVKQIERMVRSLFAMGCFTYMYIQMMELTNQCFDVALFWLETV